MVKVRINGVWVDKPMKVRLNGVWVDKPLKYRKNGAWAGGVAPATNPAFILTAVDNGGEIGYKRALSGSISQQPITGLTLNHLWDDPPSYFYMEFEGDQRTVLAPYGGLLVNGVRRPLTSWLLTGANTYNYVQTLMGFQAGQTYNLQLVA